MHKRPICLSKLRKVPTQFSWVDQRLVRDHYIDQLSPQACALYLFLVTVADAQGLSYYADPSLCQRLALTSTELHQARQALITRGLVAYQRPLSQVLALDMAPSGAPRRAPRPGQRMTNPWTSRSCSRASGRCWHDRLSLLLPDQTLA
jgi:hypothetical protein